MCSRRVAYCVDSYNDIVVENFQKRGWVEVNPEDDWNIYWAGIQACRILFNPENGYRLNDSQIINHFPTYSEISRKDLLLKHFKRYRRDLTKMKDPLAEKTAPGIFKYLDFLPTTYVLPADYNLFVEEFHKNSHKTWIIKPSWGSEGTGIFLINKLSKLKKWSKESKMPFNPNTVKRNYVISRYIDNPLLIGGKKFDLRLYVLVLSYKPLKAYLSKLGFCRFCSLKYDKSTQKMDDIFVHLTNVSVQKTGEDYNRIHGGKWTVQNLKLYLEGTRGKEVAQKLFTDINFIITQSLRAVAPVMVNDKHCFECYGYDVIIDNNLKPWLIEVNAFPSLVPTTKADRVLKNQLISDILSVVLPPNGIPNARWDKSPSLQAISNFEVLADDSVEVSSVCPLPFNNVRQIRLRSRFHC